ncbi:MAG: HDOD domain-containing protein [Opitutae bacterium]|nr:HDOD domain-containing protein [Opitutae bacterium]
MLPHPAGLPSALLTPDQVVRELRHLPSAPKVLPRLKRLLTNCNSSMSEIVALIRLDPAISARVLQTANSAYYSKGVRCFTVDEAVNRVGYTQVYELVAYAVASQVLVRPLGAYGMEPDELWRMSVACALAAEMLAGLTGEERDIAYTVGLLHCVGLLAIDEWIQRNHPGRRLVSQGFPRETCEHERALLGFTQAETGASLLRHWDFPLSMSEPIRWQYFPRSTAGYQRLACLLHAAKWVRTMALAAPEAISPPAPDAWLLQPLHLTVPKLEQCAGEVRRQLAAINCLLDSSPPEAETIEFPGGLRQFTDRAV